MNPKTRGFRPTAPWLVGSLSVADWSPSLIIAAVALAAIVLVAVWTAYGPGHARRRAKDERRGREGALRAAQWRAAHPRADRLFGLAAAGVFALGSAWILGARGWWLVVWTVVGVPLSLGLVAFDKAHPADRRRGLSAPGCTRTCRCRRP